jgi:hypothetical protein
VPVIARWNGVAWSLVAGPVFPASYYLQELRGVAALSAHNAIAVGDVAASPSGQTLVEQYTTPKLGILCGG